MTGKKTFWLVLLLLAAIVAGLNTSNNGISSLTMDNRGPVLGIDYDQTQHKLALTVLGRNYETRCDWPSSASISGQARAAAHFFCDYTVKIWRIFYAVFIY